MYKAKGLRTEGGIYKGKQENNKTLSTKKARDQEKKKEITISTKKATKKKRKKTFFFS